MKIYHTYSLSNERDQLSNVNVTMYGFERSLSLFKREIEHYEKYRSMDILSLEELRISSEDLISYFKNMLDKLLEIIGRFKDWIELNYHKLQIKFIGYQDRAKKMSMLAMNIRDKNSFKIDKKSGDMLIKLFATIDTDDVIKTGDLFFKQLDNLESFIKSVINREKITPFNYYNLGGVKKYAKLNIDNILTWYMNDETEELVNPIKDNAAFNYLDLYNLLQSYYKYLDKIKDVVKTFDSINKSIKSYIVDLHLGDVTQNKIKDLKNIHFIQHDIILDMYRWYIRYIKYTGTLLNSIIKYNVSNTPFGYEYFLDIVKNPNNPFYSKHPFLKEDLGDPNNFKLVQNYPYIYIDFKMPLTSSKGPGVSYVNIKLTDVGYESKIDLDDDNDETKFSFYKLGLVFLDSEYISKHSDLLDFKVCYWHEVGHIVTEEDEKEYKFDSRSPKDSWINMTERYIRHPAENKADAYALIKTNISIDAMWNSRMMGLATFNKENDRYVNKRGVEEWMKSISSRKQEYINNVKSYIPEIRKYVKLDLFSYLRSYIK